MPKLKLKRKPTYIEKLLARARRNPSRFFRSPQQLYLWEQAFAPLEIERQTQTEKGNDPHD